MKIVTKKNFVLVFIFLTCLFVDSIFATRNASRYFPFLERSEEIIIKKRSQLDLSVFYINAATAFKRDGGNTGIPELWGNYDLNDVVESLQAVQAVGVNPVLSTTKDPSYVGKSTKFKIDGKIRGVGLTLGYEHNLGWLGLQFGAWLPVMSINATSRFSFDRKKSDEFFNNPFLNIHLVFEKYVNDQTLLLDKARRVTHETIGFKGNEWSKSGVGDLDVHLRWNKILDHVVMMRGVDVNLQAGVLVPTGVKRDVDYPSSVPFGGDGHWGFYGDAVAEFELKEDWELGLMLGFVHQFARSKTTRIPIGHEPAIFSSLIGRVKIKPGDTFKFSPYFTLRNLADGLNIQARYTYLRHSADIWQDVRKDKTIQSYLEKDIDIVRYREDLSKHKSHYVTLQLSYDLKAAMKNYKFDPVLFVGYDVPIGGSGIVKTHQIWMGGRLRF